MPAYPKRLIEVDLPIRRISAHSRREKSIRHGHISTLHIWWARRPLAACRAVICAALWPDPVDVTEQEAEAARKDGRALQPNICPSAFRAKAKQEMLAWTSHERQILLSEESRIRFELARKKPRFFEDSLELRGALLDFVADFSNWDNSLVPEYLNTARALTQAAHESLGGQPGSRPMIVDSFAGGGSIPLEALRVGADTFASDLNPIPILLNKVVLEYIPKYGQRLADEFAKQGEWIKREAERELSRFYPIDRDGARPIAYLWARTISCEGPGCGAEVPLMRSLWLDKKAGRAVGLQLLPDRKSKRVNFQLIVKQNGVWTDKSNPGAIVENPKFVGTVKRSSATCPCCGYTTSAENTRNQFIPRSGGADDARLIAVVIRKANGSTADFRLGNEEDLKRFKAAAIRLAEKEVSRQSPLTLVPDEPLPYLRSIFNINLLGVDTWGKLFNSRQALALVVLIEKTQLAAKNVAGQGDKEFAQAVELCLAFAVDRCADYWSSLAVWAGEFVAHTFGRQALGIVWDYAEVSGFSDGSGSYAGAVGWIKRVIERLTMEATSSATVELASACDHPLPNDSANAFITDPPYYDAVPYADLADFFYVWLQ